MSDLATPHRGVSIVMKSPGRRFRFGLITIVIVVFSLAFVAARGTGYEYGPAPASSTAAPDVPADPGAARKLQGKLAVQNKQFAVALDKLAPTGTYVVVDQTQNRLYIMNDDKIVRTAVCSAGSGMILKASGSSAKKWVFDTPRGVFKVRNKISNPIWKKPDWAFVEEGKTLPTNPADRFESGTLGKYALYLEDGYMIHGTLYTRLLGRSVTHGCIRLGPEDLQAVWDAVPVGSSVYIF